MEFVSGTILILLGAVGAITATRIDAGSWIQRILVHFDVVTRLLRYVDMVPHIWLSIYNFSSDCLAFSLLFRHRLSVIVIVFVAIIIASH